jgi:hypothetical protein
MWPPIASGDEVTNVSVLQDWQLVASSGFSKPQLKHFFITLEAA